MKENKVVKVAAVALLAVTLASQTVATTGNVHAETDVKVVETVSVRQSAVVSEYTQDVYTKSQVEFLISQIVADKADTDDCDEVSYTYNDLYYSPNDKAGYVIDFTYGDSCGYIVMLVDDESAKPVEIVLDRQSPYYGKAGTYMYPSQGSYYILADNGHVVEAMQYTEMSDKPQNVVMMNSLGIIGNETPVNFSYPYDTIELYDNYEMSGITYTYSYNTDKPNTCANMAGVIALNYWNRYYENDLLRLGKGDMYSSDPYKYSMYQNTAEKYMNIFYKYMKTNNWITQIKPDILGGTLPENCYSGFARLIEEEGYLTARIDTPTYEDIKWAIKGDLPVFITSLNYCFGSFNQDDTNKKLVFDGTRSTGFINAHTFIGYGYSEYRLYDKNGKETIINFVKVTDGNYNEHDFYLAESEILSAAALLVYWAPPLPRC